MHQAIFPGTMEAKNLQYRPAEIDQAAFWPEFWHRIPDASTGHSSHSDPPAHHTILFQELHLEQYFKCRYQVAAENFPVAGL